MDWNLRRGGSRLGVLGGSRPDYPSNTSPAHVQTSTKDILGAIVVVVVVVVAAVVVIVVVVIEDCSRPKPRSGPLARQEDG
jgi:hypothetical protein